MLYAEDVGGPGPITRVVVLPYLYIDSLSVGGGGAGQRQESREGKLPAGQ